MLPLLHRHGVQSGVLVAAVLDYAVPCTHRSRDVQDRQITTTILSIGIMACSAMLLVCIAYGLCVLAMIIIWIEESVRDPPMECSLWNIPCALINIGSNIIGEAVVFWCTIVWIIAWILAFPCIMLVMGRRHRIAEHVIDSIAIRNAFHGLVSRFL